MRRAADGWEIMNLHAMPVASKSVAAVTEMKVRGQWAIAMHYSLRRPAKQKLGCQCISEKTRMSARALDRSELTTQLGNHAAGPQLSG